MAQHDVDVRERGFLTAVPIAGRAGVCAGAVRSNRQPAGLVHPRDAAAAGSNLGQVDGWRAQQIARAAGKACAGADSAPQLKLRRNGWRTIQHHRRLGGGAAHVECQHSVQTAFSGQLRGRQHAGRWPGLQTEGRQLRRLGRRHHAAAGLQHQYRRSRARGSQRLGQPPQVDPHDRLQKGIDDRGAGAVVLTDKRQHRRTTGDGRLGQAVSDLLLDLDLMPVTDVGIEQADRDGLHVGPLQHVQCVTHAVRVQGGDYRAVGGQALAHAQTQLPLDQRLGPRPAQVVEPRIAQTTDFQDIAETLGGDQPGTRPAPLQDGVGRYRAGVQQAGERHKGTAAAGPQAFQHAGIEIGRRGERFVPRDAAVRIHGDEVGKCPAYVRGRAQTIRRRTVG